MSKSFMEKRESIWSKAAKCFFFAAVSVSSVFAQTPMDKIYKEELMKSPFDVYVTYFVNYKSGGDVDLAKRLISQNRGTLGLYEGILKSLYFKYKVDPKKAGLKGSYWKDVSYLVYDKAYNKLKDTYDGLFIQNLLMEAGKYKEAKSLFSSAKLCLLYMEDVDAKACYGNQVFLRCLSSDISELYLPADMDDYKDVSMMAYEMCSRRIKESSLKNGAKK